MSGFSPDWLRTREPFDLAARDGRLASRFAHCTSASLAAAAARRPAHIIDLAAGAGANFRVLAPVLKQDQTWLLVDHDPRLLAAQQTEIAAWALAHGWRVTDVGDGLRIDTGTACWQVQGMQLDLAAGLETLDLRATDGVVTTAFLDLVSAAWLERLSGLLARNPRPLLATLSVDGHRQWRPAHPADAEVLAAFQHHQGGDKGFGSALGHTAPAHLAALLRDAGFAVSLAPSNWHIGPGHPGMLQPMLTEAGAVARASQAVTGSTITDWLACRSAQLAAGQLSLEIGHQDLLALPPGR
ncbi:hypothetical protein [Zoogloea sp.]|uniref:hypothetical protein n=1 Tax=Zoogloea sp. TaxID=49181 RepID=UPI0025FDCDB8|nr:hypothetical protein [Zoogloea sp.]MCK6396012.1 hypothetical protein [Zoogloea sp.]